MESSSYSKTRSPARFLAAFLAVVMLFIVMPVLPAGAAGNISKIIFEGVDFGEPDPAEGEFAWYFDSSENYIDGMTSVPEKWNGEAPKFEFAKDDSSKKATLTFSNAIGTKNNRSFEFYSSLTDMAGPGFGIYYSTDESNWKLLDGTAERIGTRHLIDNSLVDGASATIYIKAMKMYHLTAPATSADFLYEAGTDVTESGDFTFTIYPSTALPRGTTLRVSARNLDDPSAAPVVPTVSETGQKKDGWGDGTKYTLEATANYALFVSVVAGVNVNYTVGTGASVNGPSVIASGSKYDFTVTLQDGYEIVSVTVNGTTVTASESNKYEIGPGSSNDVETDIQQNVVITTKQKMIEVAVNGETSDEYTTNLAPEEGKISVPYGSALSFTVTLKNPKYNDPTVTIKKGEQNVTHTESGAFSSGRTFTIPRVTEEGITIYIAPGGTKQVYVTFPTVAEQEAGGYTLNGATFGQKPYGEEITFTLKVNTGWEGTPRVTRNGITLQGTKGQDDYTYKFAPTEDTVIDVTGLARRKFSVHVQNNPAFTTQGVPTEYTYGTSFSFTLTLSTGYEVGTSGITVKNGEESDWTKSSDYSVQELGSNTYRITISPAGASKLKELNLVIEGIEKIQLGITFDDSDAGYTFENKKADGVVISGDKVAYGSRVSFTVTVTPGYRLIGVYFETSSGRTVINTVGDVYQFTATEAGTVKATVKKVTITVTYRITETTTMSGNSDHGTVFEKTYDIINANEGEATVFSADDQGVKLDLTQVVPTRQGFKFDGWTCVSYDSTSDGSPFTSRNFNTTSDHTVTVDAKFSIQYDSTSPEQAYFFVGLTFQHDAGSGKDILNALVHTNLAEADRNGGATVSAYGIVYAKEKGTLEDLKESVSAGDFTVTGPKSFKQYKGQNDVIYVCLDAQNKEYDAYVDEKTNESYTVRVGHVDESCQREAFAFVILNINGTKYVFTSLVKNGEGQ